MVGKARYKGSEAKSICLEWEALEAALGPDGAEEARQRSQPLLEGGWGADWDRIE